MNAIAKFAYAGHEVRTVSIEGEQWFIAADVCRCLGIVNPSNLSRILRADKQTLYRVEGQTQRQPPYFKIISKPGLFRLILRSNMPKAKPFQDWDTRVVLRAIRKSGGYVAGQEKVALGEMSRADFMARALKMVDP